MTAQSNLGLWNSGSYIPHVFTITNITNAQNAVVTTDGDHNYVVGNEVQFLIPPQWGITELNNQTGYVLATTSNTFTVTNNTSQMSTFISASVTLPTIIDEPQVMAIGDQNTGKTVINQSTVNLFKIPATDLQIPGSSYNIYP